MLNGATIHFYNLFHESHFSNISDALKRDNGIMECIKLNWLCKHTKKVKSSQTAILALNWVNHSIFLWVSLKNNHQWKINFIFIHSNPYAFFHPHLLQPTPILRFMFASVLFIYLISNSIIWIFLELARLNEGIENPLY